MRKNTFTKKYTTALATFCAVLTAASACALSFGFHAPAIVFLVRF